MGEYNPVTGEIEVERDGPRSIHMDGDNYYIFSCDDCDKVIRSRHRIDVEDDMDKHIC